MRPSLPRHLARRARPVFSVLANKYYVDEFYQVVFVKTGLRLARTMATDIDHLLIDAGLVDGTARLIGRLGERLSHLQSGKIRDYALYTFIGALVVIAYFFLR